MNDRRRPDDFRLVRGDAAHDAAQALERLEKRPPLRAQTDHREAAKRYRLDEALETAINMALAVGEPLLVTGEPGTGKTLLAWYLGHHFGIEVRPFFVKSTSTATDLEYQFDSVGYLQSAYEAQREGAVAAPRSKFLTPGSLWLAYEDRRPSVLLIDEIDKAPRDFPNDLLNELDQAWFPHPFEVDGKGNPVPVRPVQPRPPIVVITSNLERRLPAPFLRRCIFHHIKLTRAVADEAVEAHFPELDADLKKRALDVFWALQGCNLQKAPSTAELMQWLAILGARGERASALVAQAHRLPALGALIKVDEDFGKLESQRV